MYTMLFKVDGIWGPWNNWERCAVTCGGATQTRNRQCAWPDQSNKGVHCNVDGSANFQSQICGDVSCPPGE